MESDLIQALSAEKPAVEAINRWIREQQQIAYEEAQLEAAADHVLAVIGQKKKALDERRSALETFAPTVLAHFQEREKAEGSGRTFADVEGGYVVKLKKLPVKLKCVPSNGRELGEGGFFDWDNASDKLYTHWKIKAKMTNQQYEQFQAFFPELSKFAEREPNTSLLLTHFKETGEVPPEFKIEGGVDRLYVEAPKKIGSGSTTESIEEE